MDKGTYKKKNQGFTLIELIVVIAVIAIVASISTYSFNNVTIHRVRAFANDCDALLAQCKIETMSGVADASFTIEKDGDKWVAVLNKNGGTIERPASKSKKFTCTAEIVNTRNETETISLDKITLSFDRATGQINLDSYTTQNGWYVSGTGRQCTKITIANAVGEKSILLIPQTGYHEVQ